MKTLLPKFNRNDLLSIGQAAKFLEISIDTLRRWDKEGKISAIRLDGKNRFFSQKELKKLRANSNYLTISEVARRLGVSASTIRRLEQRNKIKVQRNERGERVYKLDTLRRLSSNKSNQLIGRPNLFNSFFKPAAPQINIALLILLVISTSLSTLYVRNLSINYGPRVVLETKKVLGAKDQGGLIGSLSNVFNLLKQASSRILNLSILPFTPAGISTLPITPKTQTDAGSIQGKVPGKQEGNIVVFGSNGNIPGLQISSEHIPPSTVTGGIEGHIAPASITSFNISDKTILGTKIANDTIQNEHIADSAISSAKIAGDTISTSDLSSTLNFSNGDLFDLSAIDHTSTSKQGLILPNVASSSPSKPSSGEGYLAFDTSGNQLIFYNGSSWSTITGGSGGVTTLNSLTGALTIAGGGINTISASGSTVTVTATEADTLSSVTGRGASTTTALSLGDVTIGTNNSLIVGSFLSDPSSPSNGTIWYNSTSGKYKIRENGTTKILCNTTDAGCGAGGGSTAWSSIIDPTNNLSIDMKAFTSTFTYNATTGAGNLWKLIDTLNNSGTGYVLDIETASGSNAKPLSVVARGNTIIDTTAAGGLTFGNATSAQAITIDAGTATLNLGNSDNAKTINIGTGTAIDTINIATGGTGADLITIGSAATSWKITSAGGATFTSLNGNTITTSTGTLTLPAAKTVSFGDAFTTSGAYSLTLTTNGITSVILPTTGTLTTLAGTETLTNKTISGTSNTLSNIGNSSLTNSSVTINSSGILTGGGAVSLGGTLTLTATEADTLLSVTGRGASTTTSLTLSSATPITFSGSTPTITYSGGDTTFDLTGAATRTLNILNSTVTQVANLNLSDGVLQTGGTQRLDNSGALSNITDYSQSSGNFSILGTGTFSTGTGEISLNGSTILASGKTLIITGGAGNPVATSGTVWYDTTANKFKIVENGTVKTLCNTTDLGCGAGGGGGISTVRESDGTPSVGSLTVLEFGPASSSSDEFIVTDQTNGVARIVLGNQVGKLNEAETVTGGWIFNTATTTFTTGIVANGGIITSSSADLTLDANGTGVLVLADATLSLTGGTTVTLQRNSGTSDTLTINNAGAGSLSLNLTDGELQTNATSRLTNAGVLQNITGLTVSGTASINTSGTSNTTIGNSSGGTIQIGAGTGSDLALSDNQWSITGLGAASFASISEGGTALSSKYAPIGADFITVAANGTLTGETAIGALTTGISTTSTLNVDSTSTLNGITLDANANFAMTSGTGTFSQTYAASSDATADILGLSISAGGTGSTGTLRGLVINQADTATTGVFDSLVYIGNQKTPETTTNAILIQNNAASGTLSNALHITNTAGTLTSAIVIDGTAPGTYILDTGSIDISGTGNITGAGTIASGAHTITAASATALAIGANGTTNPVLQIDSSAGSVATGLKITGAATGGTTAIATIDSGANTNLSISAKGTGTVTLASGSTGDIQFFSASNKITSTGALTVSGAITAPTATNTINSLIINSGALSGVTGLTFSSGNMSGVGTVSSGATTITSSSGTALTVGANGATNPVLQVDASTGSVATGLKILGAATGGTTALSVIDSGSNASLSISSKGTGTVTLASGSTGDIQFFGSNNTLTSTGNLTIAGNLTIGASGAIYATAARPDRREELSPEYQGAVLTGTGTGTMTSDFCAASAGVGGLAATNTTVCNNSGDTHNYYSWTTSQGTAQTYSIFVKWRIPDNFAAWDATNSIQAYAKRSDATNGHVNIKVFDTANALNNAGGTEVAGVANTWVQNGINISGGTWAAGGYVTLEIDLTAAASGGVTNIGEININYTTTN